MIASFLPKLTIRCKRRIIFFAILSVSLVTWGQNQTFTNNGNFIVPTGVTSIVVECLGAGGAGGGTSSNRQDGGGGGAGGAYAKKTISVVPGNSYTVTVGGITAGARATGSNGDPSWFGTTGTVYAEGGAGGAAPNGGTAAGGIGSSASSIGDVVYAGGNGADGNSSLSGGGGGGAGSTGVGGNATGTTAGTGTTLYGGDGGAGRNNEGNGIDGSTYGGGGSGAFVPDNTNHSGGDGAAGLVFITTCNTASMGYDYERNITIDYTKVSGSSDLYNFPVLVNLTGQTFLQNIPSGQIYNANGYDIIFTDENYNKLDHQLEYYNGTNGDLIAWVRIPVLSSTSNTPIKIMYGNVQISTDPSLTSVWDSHYKGIWHLDNSSLNDVTSYNYSGTPYNSPTYPAGTIYNSLGLNGTNQYVEVINDPNINFAGNITVSAWARMDAGGRDQKIAGNQNNSSGGYKFGIFTNNKVEFEIRNAANVPSLNRSEPGGTVLSTGQWYYLAGISSDVLDSIKTFVDGIPERPFKKTGILGTASNTLTIGKEPFQPSYYFSGRFDEIRISDEVRSNGWMRTEYNNQSSPSTFYSLDATGVASNNIPSESLCTGPITLTYGSPSGGTYSGNPYIVGDVFTPPSAGTYSITYTYTSACGPTISTKDIIITDAPAAPSAPNKEFCESQIAFLEATSGVNIRWYSGGTLVSTANPYSPGITAPGTYNYTVTQTVNGCESPATAVSMTIFAGITINTHPQPTSICTTGNGNFSVSASGYDLTYQWQEAGANISDGGIYSGATTPTLILTNPGIAKNGLSYRCVVTSSCGPTSVNSNSAVLTVTQLPVATFSYTGTPYCPTATNPSPTFSGGGIAGTFSSTAGLVFVSVLTGQVDLSASTPGDYIVTNTIAAAGGCGIVIETSPISIIADLVWTGTVSTDWNVTGNWSCGYVPFLTTDVRIPDVPNKPVLSSGAAGTIKNLIIDIGSSLTVSSNTIQISGTITNNGTFNAVAGIVEMNGSVAQVNGSDVFATNTIKDLMINNIAGVTLQGPLNISGIVNAQSGSLSSDGYLTLLSTAAQTGLIDGSGTGSVTGDVTMQRYLSSGYGYKYFSSPLQSTTVNDFADDMTLGAFTFFRYDESRTSSGWVSYHTPTTNPLNPMEGYSVNFGSVDAPNTVDVTGVINNGNVSTTLYNNNNTYTQGFNLVGNPYPSPIDWDAGAGWTKTNIDNALYYFKASATDQYGGTYSTYINGISSDGIVNNIIPSMQAFFVHVSDGSWPVTGILSMDNNVRITDLTHSFTKSKGTNTVPLIRLSASFSDDTASIDPIVIYFDQKASPGFDSYLDALKLFNTDLKVPNLYLISQEGEKLSINALPPNSDDFLSVPLGLKLNKAGSIVFQIRNIDEPLSDMRIFLSDIVAGTEHDLLPDKKVTINLEAGEYLNRFYLNMSNITTTIKTESSLSNILNIYCYKGILKAEINKLPGNDGTLMLYNLTGQILFNKKVYKEGHYEFNPEVKDGIYIVSFLSGKERISKKIFIHN